MTELFIDNKPVMLPADLDLKVKQQNPLITKNGTFTLDLTLSLQERNNSILYKHIERLQASSVFDKRKAVLISDGHIIINGTEAFISNTNEEVKIQLLSGNSELNYFMGTDVYISSLDLGKETDFSNERLNQVIKKGFPDTDFVTPMVKIGSSIYNEHPALDLDPQGWKPYVFSNIAIQPFLLAMIEKILTALGYKIEYNEARNDNFLSSIFLLNSDKSGMYNRILPGWKVKDFLEECEKLMNLIFVIDNANRSVKILCASSNNTTGTYTINNVLDAFERTIVDDNEKVSYKNICYDFPSSTEYRFQCIEDEVLDRALLDTSQTYDDLINKLKGPDGSVLPDSLGDQLYNSSYLWHVVETDSYYIIDKRSYNFPGNPPEAATTYYYPRKVHTFRKYQSNKDEDFLKLSFFPCVYFSKDSTPWYIDSERIPYLPGTSDKEQDGEYSIKKLIENGAKDFNSTKKQVAISSFHPALNGIYFTLNDNVADYHSSNSWYQKEYGTFRLTGPDGLVEKYYQPNLKIDFTREYTIKFISNILPDVRAEFILNNKLFICKELEYRITNEGIHPEITGTFYEVK
ncbi:MAG: hypothetical protein J6K31_05085 [Parabacteroides sp.]|nr:hypothetical protein [Parabacteroides sp.]